MYRRNRVVYIPYHTMYSKNNRYIVNMIHILRQKYKVKAKMAKPSEIFDILDTKAIILNWVEIDLDDRMKKNILWHRILGVRIIWVFHDKYPHNTPKNKKIYENIKWLANNSTDILLHSKHSKQFIPNLKRNYKKSVYVPHIKYKDQRMWVDSEKIQKQYDILEDTFVFCMFGFINPYKNYENVIKSFKILNIKDTKLIIVGKAYDEQYKKKLLRLCENDRNIILDFRFLSEIELNEILDISDVVVIPYLNESSMNSGVMIQAFSCGKTVIINDFAMARDYEKEFCFYRFSTSLEKAMKRAYLNGKKINRIMGEAAKKYIDTHNNERIVRDIIFEILK